MTQPHEHLPESAEEKLRPDQQDVIDTVLEELRERDAAIVRANDERMFYKAQVKKQIRRAEVAEMAMASLQARIDQLQAELRGDAGTVEVAGSSE